MIHKIIHPTTNRRKTSILYLFFCIIILVAIFVAPIEANPFFREVLPGYVYTFPQDHFSHPGFQTEWWYYTGHLATQDGKRYGYELTFFRTGIESQRKRESSSPWVMRDIYFAHLALSDEGREEFRFWEKMNRKGPGLAGADADRLYVWNEGWLLEGMDGKGDRHHLKANEGGFGIDLILTSLKPPVIHGEDGISRKSFTPGHASHYYSLTRLHTEGQVVIAGKGYKVEGQSWMDHEFFSHQLMKEHEGWDWFSIQLENNTEVMLYQLRIKGGGTDPASSGTIIGQRGETKHLKAEEFSITPLGKWESKKSGAVYPSGWRIEIPGHALSLTVSPAFREQELRTRQATYWEGSCTIKGTYQGERITGKGYTELSGYAPK